MPQAFQLWCSYKATGVIYLMHNRAKGHLDKFTMFLPTMHHCLPGLWSNCGCMGAMCQNTSHEQLHRKFMVVAFRVREWWVRSSFGATLLQQLTQPSVVTLELQPGLEEAVAPGFPCIPCTYVQYYNSCPYPFEIKLLYIKSNGSALPLVIISDFFHMYV